MAALMTAQRALALNIVKRLRGAGKVAYFVGGCVRDQLLGIDPKDYDVATDATPDQIEEIFPRTLPIGKAFGVILVQDEREPQVNVEVATFRADGEYRDGRRPETVRFSSAEEDALRRDFTINGMFLDPVDGQVVDYVGGQRDLQAKVIRAIGDPIKRFGEDRLRLLRAVRFACRYTFAIEERTASAISACASDLPDVSPERIRQELDRMILGPARGRAIRELAEFGLLAPTGIGLAEAPEGPLAMARTAALLDFADRDRLDSTLAWAILLHGCGGGIDTVGKIPTGGVQLAGRKMRKLHHSTKDTTAVVAILSAVGTARTMSGAGSAAMKRYLRRPGMAQAFEFDRLLSVWERAHGGSLAEERYAAATAALNTLREFESRAGLDGLWPEIPVDGSDVISLGVPPGPRIGELMTMAEDAVLDGDATSREELLDLLRAWIERKSP